MRRRAFIVLLSSTAATWPLSARAQQPDRTRRIGVLMSIADEPEGRSRLAALQQGLQGLHWTEGRNLHIEVRWSGADVNRSHSYATELVGLNPDLLIAHAPLGLTSLRRQTRSIPIVFLQVPDPVEAGFVANIARPGANITGFTHFDGAMGGKWLSLLKEIAPRVSRALSIHFPDLGTSRYFNAMKTAAPSLGIQLTAAEVRSATDIESALEAFAREPHAGMIAPPSNIISVHRRLVFALAARHRLPAVYPYRYFATEGGLMSYGVDLSDLFRRSASYVDRILKGENPGELPVQAPTKFELIINVKTAKALGLTAPPTLLAQANEVIE